MRKKLTLENEIAAAKRKREAERLEKEAKEKAEQLAKQEETMQKIDVFASNRNSLTFSPERAQSRPVSSQKTSRRRKTVGIVTNPFEKDPITPRLELVK